MRLVGVLVVLVLLIHLFWILWVVRAAGVRELHRRGHLRASAIGNVHRRRRISGCLTGFWILELPLRKSGSSRGASREKALIGIRL
jgi:hypothetical protein